jgi:hypothetical protein
MGTVGALGLSILLAASSLAVEVTPTRESLEVQLELVEALPEAFAEALPSGAVIRVIYPLKVRSKRSFFWDRRLWHGEVIASATFDPITGRYRCELLLDEVMVASEERGSAAEAERWLTRPPAVRLALREVKRIERIYVRARAVYSTSTTWLVFPDSEGTEWVEAVISFPDDPKPSEEDDTPVGDS